MDLFAFAINGRYRTILCTHHTAGTLVGNNGIREQGFAHFSRAFFMVDMRFILIPEVFHGGEYGIRSGLSESAETIILDLISQFFEQVEIAFLSLSFADAGQDFEHAFGTNPAECAFSAAFLLGEIEEKFGHIHHTGCLIHYNHSTGAHNSARCIHTIVINHSIGEVFRDTSPGRTAQLYGFELFIVLNSATQLENNIADGYTHRYFYQSGATYLSGQGEYFGSFAFFGSIGSIGRGTIYYNPGDIGKGFDVVDIGGFTPQTALSREWRTFARHAAFAFNGGDEGCFFTANKSTGAFFNINIQVKPFDSKNIFSKVSPVAGLLEGNVQTLDSQRILGTAINHAAGCFNGIGTNDHSFDDTVRISFQNRSVHKGTGIAFICVADDKFLGIPVIIGQFPFHSGWKTSTPAPSEPGCQNSLYNIHTGNPVGCNFADGTVSFACFIF